MRYSWSEEILRKFISDAETRGKVEVELHSGREASLFRYAIYNIRRREGLGKDLRIVIQNTHVIIYKPQETYIKEIA